MERFLLFFCFRSCLKGSKDSEYYQALELTENATNEEIKKSYKKLSLALHPDKLAQKGLEVTAEHKQRFIKVKEAYDVLSDPKRRRLYDELGTSGLKLVENPAEVNPLDILRNFQNNRQDRCSLILIIGFLFSAVVLLPILFCLKCDGTLGDNVPWLAIWTPMWIVDFFLLITSIILFADNKPPPSDEENQEHHLETPIPLTEKIANFITTCLFILIQVFILMALDRVVNWTWFRIFAPWFAYEAINIIILFPNAWLHRIPTPTLDAESLHLEEDDAFMLKIKLECVYFEKTMEQQGQQITILVGLLRIWLAVFIALKVDDTVDWNWGLVLLPIWVYLFTEFLLTYSYSVWGSYKLKNLDIESIKSGQTKDAAEVSRYQQGSFLKAQSSSICFYLLWPLLMAVLLVCRLQTSNTYSTFIIIIPVFLFFCCCGCLGCCGILFLSCLDTEGLADAIAKEQEQDLSNVAEDGGVEAYVPPSLNANNNTNTSNGDSNQHGAYYTPPDANESTSPMLSEPISSTNANETVKPVVDHNKIDVDID